MPTLPTNGDLKKWLTGITVSVVSAAAVMALQQSCATRDMVRDLAAEWKVPEGAKGLIALREEVISQDGRLNNLESWRAEGQRFTRRDGELLEVRLTMDIEEVRRRCEQRTP